MNEGKYVGESRKATELQRYTFKDFVDMEEAEDTLLLAIIAAEALHGRAAVMMEARYMFSEVKRACVIERRGKISEDIIKLFTGFLIKEFGEESFSVILELKNPIENY